MKIEESINPLSENNVMKTTSTAWGKYVMASLRNASIVGILFMGVSAEGAEPPKLTIEKIIETVQANEILYSNLDVTLNETYIDQGTIEANRRRAKRGEKSPQKIGQTTLSETKKATVHCVLQNGLFRVERNGFVEAAGQRHSIIRIRAFDGATTRLYEQEKYANIIEGRSEGDLLIRPHELLLRSLPYHLPLSAWLSGHEAMLAYPGSIYPGYPTEISYEGEAEFNGLLCHRIWITHLSAEGAPNHRWELWLAEDRNFIPVRNIGFTFRWSKTHPLLEARVDAFTEIEPGVWFPTSVIVERFDHYKPLAESERVVKWTDKTTVKSVSLDPAFDEECFRDVEIPEGTPIYKVKDGKIIDE